MLINKLNDYLYNTDHDDINHTIAKYIKRNISNISNMTIDELAKECYVSKAKISKFCKLLGYDNFIALKDDCNKQLKINKLVLNNKNNNINYKDYIYRSLNLIKENIDNTNLDIINNLVKDIYKSKYVYLYGIDYGNLLCKYMQYESDILSKEVIIIDELLVKDYIIKDSSIIIVLSIEGKDLLDNTRIIHKLDKYKCTKWIITTDVIDDNLLKHFNKSLIISSNNMTPKDRLITIRYIIDIIMDSYAISLKQ